MKEGRKGGIEEKGGERKLLGNDRTRRGGEGRRGCEMGKGRRKGHEGGI